MDYNEEMLRLYFFENNFSKEKIDYLLENNPFDVNFVIWEKQTKNNNKTFAINLKRKDFIKQGSLIQEISIHNDNNVGQYLHNNIIYTPCSLRNNINNIKLNNRLVLFNGFYKNELKFLKKLEYLSNPYITGICTKKKHFYEFVLNQYKSFLEELQSAELFDEKNEDQYILTLKSK